MNRIHWKKNDFILRNESEIFQCDTSNCNYKISSTIAITLCIL